MTAKPLRFYLLVFFLTVLAGCGDSESAVEVDSPPAGTQFFFNVFGDSRSGNSIYSSLISTALTAGNPDLNFHVGDMISAPDNGSEWPFFDSISSLLKIGSSFYVVIGNHDVNDQDSFNRLRAVYPFVTATGYYTVTHKTGYFIIMNSQEVNESSSGEVSRTQIDWLEARLASAEAQQASFIVVFLHRPLFPQNHHKDEPLAENAELHQLFINYGVHAVFSGHEHSYSHIVKDGIHYLITGTSGSPLFEEAGVESAFYHFAQVSVLSNQLYVRIFDLFGRKRDVIEIAF